MSSASRNDLFREEGLDFKQLRNPVSLALNPETAKSFRFSNTVHPRHRAALHPNDGTGSQDEYLQLPGSGLIILEVQAMGPRL